MTWDEIKALARLVIKVKPGGPTNVTRGKNLIDIIDAIADKAGEGGGGTNLPAEQQAALAAADTPGATNAYATVKQLPVGRVSVTRIADGARQYFSKYTDVQTSTLPGDIVDILYPITAVLPPNTATVLPLERGVNLNLNGLPIAQTAGAGKVGLLIKYNTGYVNGNGALIYAAGLASFGIRLPANVGNGALRYQVNDVNLQASNGAVGLYVSDFGTIAHTGDITTVGDGCIGIRADLSGVVRSKGVITATGTSQAINATSGAKVTHSGRINLGQTATIVLTAVGTELSLEQGLLDGLTNRTAGSYLLIQGGAGSKLILTEYTLLGEPGQTVIQVDTIEYRGRCKVLGDVVANTVIGSPGVGAEELPPITPNQLQLEVFGTILGYELGDTQDVKLVRRAGVLQFVPDSGGGTEPTAPTAPTAQARMQSNSHVDDSGNKIFVEGEVTIQNWENSIDLFGSYTAPEGHPVTVRWRLVSKPAGSSALMHGWNTTPDERLVQDTYCISMDVAGPYGLEFTVTDTVTGLSATDTLSVTKS